MPLSVPALLWVLELLLVSTFVEERAPVETVVAFASSVCFDSALPVVVEPDLDHQIAGPPSPDQIAGPPSPGQTSH